MDPYKLTFPGEKDGRLEWCMWQRETKLEAQQWRQVCGQRVEWRLCSRGLGLQGVHLAPSWSSRTVQLALLAQLTAWSIHLLPATWLLALPRGLGWGR